MKTPDAGPKDRERLVVSPRRAEYLLDIGHTHLYDLLAAGELDSFLDGRSRKITVDSIHRYIRRRLEGSAQLRGPDEDSSSKSAP